LVKTGFKHLWKLWKFQCCKGRSWPTSPGWSTETHVCCSNELGWP